MQKKKLLSIDISLGPYTGFTDELIGHALSSRSYYACVANVHMLVEAHKSAPFANIVNNADMVTPDGKPLTWGLRLLYGIKQQRVAGMDILPDLLAEAEKKQIPVGFYGGTPAMLDATEKYIRANYSQLKIACLYSPPFRPLTGEEEAGVVKMINDSGAKLVFAVLGCPKQEKWMADMKGKINAVMIGIGGALPVLVGMQKRAPKWMQRSGLEWFFRLSQEPRRLFKRYATTNSLFILLLLKKKLSFKKD